MFSRLWLINLVLAAGVIFFGLKAYEVWSEEDKRPSETGPINKPLPLPGKKVAKLSVPPESGYEVVVSNNLFSVERSELKPQIQGEKPKTVPKSDERELMMLERAFKLIDLYGVIIANDYKAAFITEISVGGPTGGSAKRPTRAFARVNKQGVKRVKEGDTVGRFKVKEIEKTSVLLTAGGREWQVSLFDKDKPKRRVAIKKATGPVVVGAGSKDKAVRKPEVIGEKKVVPERAVFDKDVLEKARRDEMEKSRRDEMEKARRAKRKMLPVPNKTGNEKR